MAIKNRYSDPALGQAFENIAGLFAPMSGSDLAGYATADANRQKALAQAQQTGLIDMFVSGDGPIDDRIGIGAGLYTPNQSMGAVQMGDATNRRGQDVSAATSITNNQADNARAVDLGIMADGTTRRGQDIGLQGDMYSADRVYGASTENNVRDNRTELQTTAMGELLNPLDPGQQTRAIEPDVWAAMGLGDMPATPEYSNDRMSGSDVKMTNARLPDGTQTTAMQTPQGLVDAATGAPLPQGTTMFSTAAQGSADDVGLGRTPEGKIQLELVDNTSTQDVGNRVIELVSQNPASQGAVGWMRSKAQDLMQTGTEIGAYFGGEIQRVSQDVTSGVADATLMSPGGAFDTTLPAIDLMLNLYVYNYAKSITGERLSNEAVRQWRVSMGLDNALGNQANTMARLTEAQRSLQERETRLRSSLGGVVPPAGPAPAGAPAPNAAPVGAPAAPAAPAAEGPVQRLRYNPATGAFE